MEPRPSKRQRLEEVDSREDSLVPVRTSSLQDEVSAKYTREADVGITEFVNPEIRGFDCILKYKYSDFVVNEVGLDGEVILLKDTTYAILLPENKNVLKSVESKQTFTSEKDSPDLSPLVEFLPSDVVDQLRIVYMSKGVDVKEVLTSELSKDQRTAVHQAIRAVFKNKLDSQATPSGSIRITYVSRPSKRSRHPPSSWDNGEYCHFTMRKNNRDTMSAASMLSKWLKCHAKVIGYAGTKDRRAVTTQRMSAYRVKAERLAALNKIANPAGIILGDFAYASKPVKLGDLRGNRFTITLREIPSSVGLEQIQNAIKAVGQKGFINYYGMQRFGTSLVSTHSVGALLLNGKWKEACEAILDVKAGAMNDSFEARELYSSGNIESAFENMPRNCIAERAVLGVLKKNPKHYSGAFQAIPRNLRLMYVHAYQSYVWNVATSARIRLSRTDVLEGDLVVMDANSSVGESVLEDPDSGHEFSLLDGERKERVVVKALSAEDVAAKKYTIYDIVLPTPGYDVIYPERAEPRQAYVETMAIDGLDPFDMRRVVREVSMSGHYRRILHRPDDVQYTILRYSGKDTLLDTDEEFDYGEFVALRVQLRLGTSQYATMALREICKRDSTYIQFWGKERDEQEREEILGTEIENL